MMITMMMNRSLLMDIYQRIAVGGFCPFCHRYDLFYYSTSTPSRMYVRLLVENSNTYGLHNYLNSVLAAQVLATI